MSSAPPLADHLRLFSTPVMVFDLPGLDDHNRPLAELFAAESRASPGLQRSNSGGWHSLPDLAQRPDPRLHAVLQALVDRLADSLGVLAAEAGLGEPPRFRYGLSAWAMVMRDGDYTILHDHGDSHFSSAYYLDAGDADDEAHPMSGQLAFVDPRRGGPPIVGLELFNPTVTVRPRTGRLVLFPGYLQHYVHAYRGTRPRVCISCNVQLGVAGSPPR